MPELSILSHLIPGVKDFLIALKISGERREVPNISWSTSGEIIHQIRSINPKNILEIGPANGFSTLMIHIGFPNAHISSIEFSRHAFEELRLNIHKFLELKSEKIDSALPAELGRKITSDIYQEEHENFSLYYGDAREVLPFFIEGNHNAFCQHPKSQLNIPQQRFDVIFIDGTFRMTQEFYNLSVPLLSPGGIIIIDDVIKYRWKMDGFYEYLDSLNVSYDIIQTDPDDGIMVIKNLNLLEGVTP